MATPLSPLSPSNTNRIAPLTAERTPNYRSPKKHPNVLQDDQNLPSSPGDPPSSPFVADVDSSPIKPDSSSKTSSPTKEPPGQYEPRQLTEDALRENEDFARASQPVEDDTMRTNDFTIHDDTVSAVDGPAGYAGMDDTAFSAFSAVPNPDMTRFARLGQSPTKSTFGGSVKSPFEKVPTPRPTGRNTPSRNRHQYDDGYSSPTPRRQKPSRDNDTTNLLIDFTGQFNPAAERSPSRNGRLSPKKYHTQSELASHLSSRRTPSPAKQALPPGTPSESRHLANLLDFDLPPAPTPRSIPSISARELESMKSAFQSQISSLKAELSGKEAEVSSLKHAMGDAERRVGESLEQVREERDAKEGLQVEKASLETRQQEMQTVLKDVKEEIIRSEREKEQLLQRVSEAEYRRQDAESKVVEAESKIAGMRASSSSTAPSESGSANTNSEVEAAVTKVAKELHGLYKTKHEAKVTALKKSYSDRWEKKIKDLQAKIDELSKENDDWRIGRDATMTGVEPGALSAAPSPESEAEKENERQKQEKQEQRLEEQRRQLSNVERELENVRRNLASSTEQNVALVSQLSASRAETADLIAATEELMTLSQHAMASSSAGAANAHPPPPDARSTLSRSTSGSGLKAPGFGGYSGESRIGRMPAPSGYRRDRGENGAGGRSGLLGNIERMGRGRIPD
ncbi:hypothetical protein IMSHALPRED_005144 [Imshaugia aleurites]|uniref:Uncharacterized protein n=1 Tax=Imshaugia aleurites TaxID=172621 RepID=A0A8H3FAY7_9LECA|nr:hypothetical protein IMSHALPRED_005144 [Imshaugia aleurites]